MASKGKAVLSGGKDSSSNKNRGVKRKNRDVLQFFDDAAVDSDGNDDSDDIDNFFDDDDFMDDYDEVPIESSGPGKFEKAPFFPKEEELSGDELEKILEERYRSGSGFVRYAEDDYETKRSVDRSYCIPSAGEPIIWKVKCKVGREKNVVFCLMQKYVDLKDLGTKLQIISVFAVVHIKGFIFVEAAKQSDVTEACNQLADVYFSLVNRVPSNELGQLLNVRQRQNQVRVGTWARVRNGIYRGDLAQVVAVNSERKRATVKLIPRIDLQLLTEKYSGGASLKRTKNAGTKSAVPAARLICPRDLEEFRPLIQYRRDRDVGQVFEFLDGLMLKDGFLYKKVSIDSLIFWDVSPSEDELLKFSLPPRDDADNLEWLSQLYGEQKQKCNVKITKGGGKGEGGKGEGSSGSDNQSSFEVHDLVLFGKRDFGMVIGMEKDESYKILKEGSEGPVTLTLGQKELKYVTLDKKFTALDHRKKTISVNDTVRILDGPIKDKQGIVKQIYRGIVFLYDESDLDNAYFCSKSQIVERVKHSDSACHGKDEEGPSTFEDVPSSPKSPLSPKRPWQMRENSDDRKDKGEMLSVGQSLRIRIGPLKGYLCRVLAVRYSDVTVKLDSQQKVLTVKREHLSEVRGTSSTQSMSEDPVLGSSFKPFELLGAEGGENDWLQGATGSASGSADGGWNVASSNEGTTWPASSWGSSIQVGTTVTAAPDSVDNDSGKDDAPWLSKVNCNQKSSCDGNAAGTSDGGWGTNSGAGAPSSWGKAKVSDGDVSLETSSQGWADNAVVKSWEQGSKISKETSSWSNQITDKGKDGEESGGWNNLGSSGNVSTGWGKQKSCEESTSIGGSSGKQSSDVWADAKRTSDHTEGSWGKAEGNWGCKNSSVENKGWGSSTSLPESQAGASDHKQSDWSQAQGQAPSGKLGSNQSENVQSTWATGTVTDGNDRWAKAKDSSTETLTDDPWGKVVDKLGNKDSSSKSKGWGSSSAAVGGATEHGQDDVSVGWTKSQDGNSAGWGATGGWKSQGDSSQAKTNDWKTKLFGDDSGGNGSWGQSKSFDNDQGSYGGRGSGGRRGRGRDQFGRGRGRGRSDNSSFSNFNKDGQDNYSSGNKSWNQNEVGSSWGNSSGGDGQSSWGKGKGWNGDGDGNNSNESAGGGSWNKGGTGDSSGWKKDGDDWQGKSWDKGSGSPGGGSWSKAGNSSWGERSEQPENDQGFGSGRGFGRRGRGRGFGRGRDQSGGRDGGRSGGRGQFSSWKGEGQGGSSWGNSSAGNGGGNSWSTGGESEKIKAGGEGGSSWGGGSNNISEGNWGNSGGWSQKGGDSGDNGSSGNTGWKAGQGGTSLGSSQSGGNSSWGKTSGQDGGGNSWNKGWSSGGERQNKDQTKTDEGGSSWGGVTNNSKTSWGSAGGWSKGQDNANTEMSGKKSWNSDQGGSSWGKPDSDQGMNKPGEGGSSWGKLDSGDGNKPNDGRSAWGGSSWGKPQSDQGGPSWGKQDSVEGKNKPGEGGSSWGKPQSNEGGSSWGKQNSAEGGSSWGKPQSDESKNKPGGGGSSWGNSQSGGSWGKPPSGGNSRGGWGS